MFYEKRKNDIFIADRAIGGRLGYKPHMHYHLELVYLYEGSSVGYIDSERHEIPKDSIFLSFPNQLHAYESYGPESYLLIIVNPVLMPQLAPFFDNMTPEDPVLRNVSAYPELHRILEGIRTEEKRERDALSSPKFHGLVQALFAELFRHMPLRDQIKGDSGALREVVNFCARNFDREFSLSVLAEELHMSKYYISHLFGSRINMKFNDYINSLRVSAASRYLSNTDKSITEISELVGFGTSRTFNRAFLKHFGKSPSEYRAANALETVVGERAEAVPTPTYTDACCDVDDCCCDMDACCDADGDCFC